MEPNSTLTISVFYANRADGGVRVTSPNVPGFILSHPDRELVFQDIVPALETILSEKYDKPVRVSLSSDAAADDKTSNVVGFPSKETGVIDYVARAA
ncbi:MAG: hypothetical protein GY807_06885 [Gammaproteobacteria bacterium]|nr:hypothetical protein [Gammaproteobacteria bacterium]